MKKFLIIRLLLIIVILAVILTLTYYALSFSMNEKYYQLPFKEFLDITIDDYKEYVQNVLKHNDWGLDSEGDSVWTRLEGRIPISLKINLAAFAIYLPVGISLGLITAYFKDTFLDRLIISITLIISSIPTFILMFLLVMFVGYYWGIVWDHYIPSEGINNYLIPLIALCIPPIAVFTRVVRGEIIENLGADYLLLARVKGLSKRQALLRHGLKNSIVPLLPEIPTAFLLALTGSFLVEVIYGIPGVAQLMFDNLLALGPFGAHYVRIEINVMMVVTLFYSSLALITCLLIDISHRIIDPRIMMGANKQNVY